MELGPPLRPAWIGLARGGQGYHPPSPGAQYIHGQKEPPAPAGGSFAFPHPYGDPVSGLEPWVDLPPPPRPADIGSFPTKQGYREQFAGPSRPFKRPTDESNSSAASLKNDVGGGAPPEPDYNDDFDYEDEYNQPWNPQPGDASYTVDIKKGSAKGSVERAMAAIEKVHKVGPVSRITVLTDYSVEELGGVAGQYDGTPGQEYIAVARNGKWPSVTAAHEHFHHQLKQGMFGTRNYNDPQYLQGLRQAIKNSQAYADLKQAQICGEYTKRGGTKKVIVDPKELAYIMDEEEMCCRSYGQLIAIEAGDPVMYYQIVSALVDNVSLYGRQYWEFDDFKPIAVELKKLLQNRGNNP
jgi:hypothetical protein